MTNHILTYHSVRMIEKLLMNNSNDLSGFLYNWTTRWGPNPEAFGPRSERRNFKRRLIRAAEIVLFIAAAVLFSVAIGLAAAFAGMGM